MIDLTPIVAALDAEGITSYRIVAPEGAEFPFVVLSIISGRMLYAFEGGIESYRLQMAHYSRWTGTDAPGLAAMEAVIAAIDFQAMGGIILTRERGPIAQLVDGRILQVIQDFTFEQAEP